MVCSCPLRFYKIITDNQTIGSVIKIGYWFVVFGVYTNCNTIFEQNMLCFSFDKSLIAVCCAMVSLFSVLSEEEELKYKSTTGSTKYYFVKLT